VGVELKGGKKKPNKNRFHSGVKTGEKNIRSDKFMVGIGNRTWRTVQWIGREGKQQKIQKEPTEAC